MITKGDTILHSKTVKANTQGTRCTANFVISVGIKKPKQAKHFWLEGKTDVACTYPMLESASVVFMLESVLLVINKSKVVCLTDAV